MPQEKIRVTPSKVWERDDGMRASIYGAVPWTSAAEESRWKIVTKGWTWEVTEPDGRVTVGLGRVPAKTYEEAREVADRFCATFGAWRLPTEAKMGHGDQG